MSSPSSQKRKKVKQSSPDHMMDSTVMGERGQVVIPKAIRERLGLKSGSRLVVMQAAPQAPIMLLPATKLKSFILQMTKHLTSVTKE